MAVQFEVLPSRSQIFLAPFVSISATDTTEAVSAVSGWNWFFNNTVVSTASTWQYYFFDPILPTNLYLNVSTPYGNFSSSQYLITIEDAWPSILSFRVLPDNSVAIDSTVNSTTITAQDTSPVISGVSAWDWTFNGVDVGHESKWIYTFFDSIAGEIGLTVYGSAFDGASAITPQQLTIAKVNENACAEEPITPEGHRGSTTLNHAISSYDYLVARVKRQLGWPAVNIEMCDESIYDFIDQAIEWYSKYAGYTEEYLMFSSSLYECGKGVRLDNLFTQYACWNCTTCNTSTQKQAATAQFIDCDLNSYRKVNGVFSVNPVEYTGTDTLFTLDYLFAQQTYFSYMLGSFGFDLITWHVLKDWLNLREKLFATMPQYRFDPRSQYLKMVPEPKGAGAFYGVIGCYVERPIKDLVKERWVQRYTLALTMIALGHIRGKFGQVTLFGGGTINATDIMTQGLDMKKELEDELMNKFGEVVPAAFICG